MRGGDAAGGGAGQVPVPGRGLAARPARVPAQGLPRAQVRVAACLDTVLCVIRVIINNICWQPPPRHALAARPRPCPARRPPHRHLPLRLQARRRRHAALRPRYMRSEENILHFTINNDYRSLGPECASVCWSAVPAAENQTRTLLQGLAQVLIYTNNLTS